MADQDVDLAAFPEIAVVLGGGLLADGSPSPSTVTRAHAAANLVRERKEMAVIVSGSRGGPDDSPPSASEAESMARLIGGAGIGRDRIFIEDESRDTIGNAVLVATRYLRGIEPRPIYVVTSPFHLERAVTIFRHVLGFAWQIQAVSSADSADDTSRANTETRLLQDTTAFFADLRSGDLAAIARRLRERFPYYQGVERLEPTRLR